MMKRLLLCTVTLGLMMGAAHAVDLNPGPALSIDASATITAGNTFQTIINAQAYPNQRKGLTIQNNNASTDNCWVFPHAGTASKAKAILLVPGGAYVRYFPYVPSEAIQVTCASSNDTIYADTN